MSELDLSSLSQILNRDMRRKNNRFESTLPAQIDAWLADDSAQVTRPLFVVQDPLAPTKTVLSNWAQQHNRNTLEESRDIIIMHYVSIGPPNDDPDFMLFSIASSLRQHLHMTKPVEVEPQSMRKVFPIWLRQSSEIILKQDLHEHLRNINSVILVIQGLDNLRYDKDLFLWLPKTLPPKIRMVLTMSKSLHFSIPFPNESINFTYPSHERHIKARLERHLDLLEERTRPVSLLIASASKLRSEFAAEMAYKLVVPNFMRHNHQIQQRLLAIDFMKLQTCSKPDDIYALVLEVWHNAAPSAILVLSLLASSYKGLSFQQLVHASKAGTEMVEILLEGFDPLLVRNSSYYSIKSRKLKNVLAPYLKGRQGSILIKQSLLSNKMQLERLQQLIYHLKITKNYAILKQVLTPIQNVLLLFNSQYSFQLFSCWHLIITKLGIDPVEQLNKSLDSYKNECIPSLKDLFSIIVRIAKFFYCFSQFEKWNNPQFNHLIIIADKELLKELTLFEEFKNQKIILDQENFSQDLQHSTSLDFKQNIRNRVNQLCGLKIKRSSSRFNRKISKNQKKYSEGKKNEGKKPTTYNLKKLAEEVFPSFKREGIESKLSKQRFRSGYQIEVKQFLRRVGILKRGYGNQEIFDFPYQFDYNLELQLDYQSNRGNQKYYYKRWIWIQLPCLSLELTADFSRQMSYFSSGKMTKAQEHEKYNKCLEIALNVKQKAKILFQNRDKPIELLPRLNKSLKKLNVSKVTTPAKDGQLEGELTKGLADEFAKIMGLKGEMTSRDSIDFTSPFLTDRVHSSTNVKKKMHQTGISTLSISKAYRQRFAEVKVAGRIEHHLFTARKQLDDTRYKNRHLEQQLELIEKNMSEEQLVRQNELKVKLLYQLNNQFTRLQKERRSFAKSEIVFKRFNVVLNICNLNGTYCKQWIQYLNKFNNNLKKMIKQQISSASPAPKPPCPLRVRPKREAPKAKIERKQTTKFAEESIIGINMSPFPQQSVRFRHNVRVQTRKSEPRHQNRATKQLLQFFEVQQLNQVYISQRFRSYREAKEKQSKYDNQVEQLRAQLKRQKVKLQKLRKEEVIMRMAIWREEFDSRLPTVCNLKQASRRVLQSMRELLSSKYIEPQ